MYINIYIYMYITFRHEGEPLEQTYNLFNPLEKPSKPRVCSFQAADRYLCQISSSIRLSIKCSIICKVLELW